MKKSEKRYTYIGVYYGDAVYEPAEGGYYVEITRLNSAIKLSYKHARRKLRHFAEEWRADGYEVSEYNDGIVVHTGPYIGDVIKFLITRKPESREEHYHGYC